MSPFPMFLFFLLVFVVVLLIPLLYFEHWNFIIYSITLFLSAGNSISLSICPKAATFE
jgi:hypothetical protein